MSKQLNILSFISDEAISVLSNEDKSALLSFLISFNNGTFDQSTYVPGSDYLSLIISMAIHSYNVVFSECDLSGQNPKIEITNKEIAVVKSDLSEEEALARANKEEYNINNYNNIYNINNTEEEDRREREGNNVVIPPERETKSELNPVLNPIFEENKPLNEDWFNDKSFFDEVKNMWNKTCVSLPEVIRFGRNLSRGLSARTREMEFSSREEAIAFYADMLNKIQESDYLTGKVKNWSASFDWVFCHPNNFTNIINGKYRNGNNRKSDTGSSKNNFGTYKPNGDIKVATGSESSVEDMVGFDFDDFEK